MELAYKVFGGGKPLIILHGIFGSSDNWVTVGKKLAESFRVFIPDQRNHGDSFHSDDFNYDAMAEDLLAFIKQHHIEKPVIIGHSMGGKTAMRFAVDHPALFDKMVIVDIGPKAYPAPHQSLISVMTSLNTNSIGTRMEADEQLQKHIPDPRVRQFLLKNLKRTGNGYKWKINLSVIAKNIDRMGEGFQRNAYTDKPILFIRGGNSDYILDQDIISIASLFPNSNVITIPDAGHWVHADKPDEFIRAVEDFIRS